MKYLIYLILVCGFGGCQAVAMSKKITPTGEGSVTFPETGSVPTKEISFESVKEIAVNSQCAKYSFKGGQGLAPKSFLKGIALTYAKAACNPLRADVVVASQPLGSASKDALAHYGISTETSDEILRQVYSLLVGSAMRESSGRWCVGKDAGASNFSAETCEAGLYQTSFNSRSAHRELPLMFASYKANPKGCFFEVYSQGISCDKSNLKNYGFGDGVIFQKLSKECPAFATEYAAVMFRTQRTHYGPLNTRKAELRPECTAMFKMVYDLVKANPSICANL